jgi:hypothetical protein
LEAFKRQAIGLAQMDAPQDPSAATVSNPIRHTSLTPFEMSGEGAFAGLVVKLHR